LLLSLAILSHSHWFIRRREAPFNIYKLVLCV
jgi:hypothetical protein